MNWVALILAGICEIGWPLGFKLSQIMENRAVGICIAVVSMSLSGALLWWAQKTISMGTAYAIWTGIGAAGTFIIGVILFKDPINVFRVVSVSLIIAGVIGLKLSH